MRQRRAYIDHTAFWVSSALAYTHLFQRSLDLSGRWVTSLLFALLLVAIPFGLATLPDLLRNNEHTLSEDTRRRMGVAATVFAPFVYGLYVLVSLVRGRGVARLESLVTQGDDALALVPFAAFLLAPALRAGLARLTPAWPEKLCLTQPRREFIFRIALMGLLIFGTVCLLPEAMFQGMRYIRDQPKDAAPLLVLVIDLICLVGTGLMLRYGRALSHWLLQHAATIWLSLFGLLALKFAQFGSPPDAAVTLAIIAQLLGLFAYLHAVSLSPKLMAKLRTLCLKPDSVVSHTAPTLQPDWLVSKRPLVILGLFLTSAYLSPYLIYGQDACVLIHDFLDSNFVWSTLYISDGAFLNYSGGVIPEMLGGLDRRFFMTDWTVSHLFYATLPPYWAMVGNLYFLHLTAFIGMFVLLNRHIIGNTRRGLLLAFAAALVFAWLPHRPSAVLSIAGQPLALYVFLNFRKHEATRRDWLIVLLLPFASVFISSFFFLLLMMGAIWLYDLVRTRRATPAFFGAIIAMTGMFVLVEHRLILANFLFDNIVSHRSEMVLIAGLPFLDGLKQALHNLAHGQYHVPSLQFPVILTTFLLAAFLIRRGTPAFRVVLPTSLAIALFSLLYGICATEVMQTVYSWIPPLKGFNFGRFHWLHPMLWLVLFAACASVLVSRLRFGGLLVVVLIVLQLALSVSQSHFIQESRHHGITFRQFFDEPLFARIKKNIGMAQSDYKVAAVGMHPAILQYNGFLTLGGYYTFYSLDYKHAFRRVIAPELNKNESLKSYFDDWGSRAYVFSAELGRTSGCRYGICRHPAKAIDNLALDMQAFRQLGGRYLFSVVDIGNAAQLGLNLRGIFTTAASHWRVHVYELAEP